MPRYRQSKAVSRSHARLSRLFLATLNLTRTSGGELLLYSWVKPDVSGTGSLSTPCDSLQRTQLSSLATALLAIEPAAPPSRRSRGAAAAAGRSRCIGLVPKTYSTTPGHAALTSVRLEAHCKIWERILVLRKPGGRSAACTNAPSAAATPSTRAYTTGLAWRPPYQPPARCTYGTTAHRPGCYKHASSLGSRACRTTLYYPRGG